MKKTPTQKITLFIAQGAYAGRFPFAPGTAGSLVGVLLYLLLRPLPPVVYFTVCIVTIGLAIWSSNEAEKLLGQTDPPSVVIDEIAGYLVAMFLVPPYWVFPVAAFFVFRWFDIIKPFPLRQLQDLHGGKGVVLDDIGAGVYTNLVLQAVWFFLEK